ncbi:nucleotidyltransferase domain-containing protein [Candidatus Pacearchaeota archaeon]|nr:nucleotidyltransferase domain-containing protein [Candidatus Pacearchaeota archaeon]
MNKIVKLTYGSHLYGTSTPDSDMDIKGIYLPTKEDLFLQQVENSIIFDTRDEKEKNTSEDTDEEYYSLQYFIKLACKGETVALDMLHCPKDKLYVTHPIWDKLVENKEKFYTKNLVSFIGFARTQAIKYSIKGDKLIEARNILSFFAGLNPLHRLAAVWKEIPEGKYVVKHPATGEQNGLRMLEICGRKLPETASADYAFGVIETVCNKYGERAKLAATNDGMDWKALSHATRAAFQIKSILKDGTITFPLAIADDLRDIKLGKKSYVEEVVPQLEELIEEVEGLLKASDLPEEVDREYWDNFILEAYNEWG